MRARCVLGWGARAETPTCGAVMMPELFQQDRAQTEGRIWALLWPSRTVPLPGSPKTRQHSQGPKRAGTVEAAGHWASPAAQGDSSPHPMMPKAKRAQEGMRTCASFICFLVNL